MASVFPFPLPMASLFRPRASTRRFPLGPFRWLVLSCGQSPASFMLSRRQHPSFPRRSRRSQFRRSRGPSVGGEPNHALQRTVTGGRLHSRCRALRRRCLSLSLDLLGAFPPCLFSPASASSSTRPPMRLSSSLLRSASPPFAGCRVSATASFSTLPPVHPRLRCADLLALFHRYRIRGMSQFALFVTPSQRCLVHTIRLPIGTAGFLPVRLPLPRPAPNHALQRTEAGGTFLLHPPSFFASLCR